MSQEDFAPGEEPMHHVRRPVSEPGHRYAPRQIRSRPNIPAGPTAVKVTPLKQAHPNNLVDPFIPTVRKSKSTQQFLKPALPRQHRSQVLKRQFVDRAEQFTLHNRQQRKSQAKAFVFGGVAVLAILGTSLLIKSLPNPASTAQAPVRIATLGVSTEVGGTPDETPVTTGAMSAHKVKADQPRVLRIPRLQMVARVLAVDTNVKGEPLTPNNIFDTGWLKTTAKPGEAGGALVTGSVIGPTKAGIFANIINLTVGDEIQVERGDGSVEKFTVVKSQTYPADKVDLAAATKSVVAGKPGLNLMTATGRFNVKTNQFEPRTIIFAVKN